MCKILHVNSVVTTHVNEISVCKILSIILYALAPHIGGMNGDVQSDIVTLEFKNGGELKIFIAYLSGLDKKLTSPEKLSLLKDFSFSNPGSQEQITN